MFWDLFKFVKLCYEIYVSVGQNVAGTLTEITKRTREKYAFFNNKLLKKGSTCVSFLLVLYFSFIHSLIFFFISIFAFSFVVFFVLVCFVLLSLHSFTFLFMFFLAYSLLLSVSSFPFVFLWVLFSMSLPTAIFLVIIFLMLLLIVLLLLPFIFLLFLSYEVRCIVFSFTYLSS